MAGAVFNQSSLNTPIQNGVNAVESAAEIFDPSMGIVQTAHEIIGETIQNIQSGNYFKAATTPFTAVPRFLNNFSEAALSIPDVISSVSATYNDYKNKHSVLDDFPKTKQEQLSASQQKQYNELVANVNKNIGLKE